MVNFITKIDVLLVHPLAMGFAEVATAKVYHSFVRSNCKDQILQVQRYLDLYILLESIHSLLLLFFSKIDLTHIELDKFAFFFIVDTQE